MSTPSPARSSAPSLAPSAPAVAHTTRLPSVSFEFFPPATPEGMDKLRGTRKALLDNAPEFFSVTYGAGGSTQEKTVAVVTEMAREGYPIAPHLSCVGSSRDDLKLLLDQYRAAGIRRIVALRGDLPSGMVSQGAFRYANELVGFIREHSGDWFRIEVACYPETHPQATSPDIDLANFRRKVDAGANSAITQYFYNPDAYFDFLERARRKGIDIPIIPGIMPIQSYTQLARFSETCGAEIPRWIRMRLAAFHDDVVSLRAFGHDVVVAMCDRLLSQGVPSLHFYTLNQAAPSTAIWQALKGSARKG